MGNLSNGYMRRFFNAYKDGGYELMNILNGDVFVFINKSKKVRLVQIINPSSDGNKQSVGINSLKTACTNFIDIHHNCEIMENENIKCYDFIISSPPTDSSNQKFYEHIKTLNLSVSYNYCGLNKMIERLAKEVSESN